MNWNTKQVLGLLFAGLMGSGLVSCEDELFIENQALINAEGFNTQKAVYPVHVSQTQIQAAMTNKLSVYQLGNYNDPIFGTTQASIATQVRLASGGGNPTFGIYSQNLEDSGSYVDEAEKVTKVILYLPFTSGSDKDSDSDGVPDVLDIDPLDPGSDTDGDGVNDLAELANGTNPLSKDTDADGIFDNLDEEFLANTYPRTYTLDSIYGDKESTFRVQVRELKYFLNDLDPLSDYLAPSEYYSDQDFHPNFTGAVLYDGNARITNQEFIQYLKDNSDTEVDESLQIDYRQPPGLRLELNKDFFQTHLLSQEGRDPLLSQSNFADYFRGLHISIPEEHNLMMLLDLTQAKIRVEYLYSGIDADGNQTGKEGVYTLDVLGLNTSGVIGNAVNTIKRENPAALNQALAAGADQKIYLKGGNGVFAQVQLFGADGGADMIAQIKANKWIINEARLSFYVDRETLAQAGYGEEPPRLNLYNAATDQIIFNPAYDQGQVNTALGAYPNFNGLRQEGTDGLVKYTFRVTDYLNNLVLRDSVNAPLALTVTPDFRYTDVTPIKTPEGNKKIHRMSVMTPLGTVLYGPSTAVPQDRRLQLEVFYTPNQ